MTCGSPAWTPGEVHADPQVVANGRAPEVGEHTGAVLVDLGLTWEDIIALKDQGAIT